MKEYGEKCPKRTSIVILYYINTFDSTWHFDQQHRFLQRSTAIFPSTKRLMYLSVLFATLGKKQFLSRNQPSKLCFFVCLYVTLVKNRWALPILVLIIVCVFRLFVCVCICGFCILRCVLVCKLAGLCAVIKGQLPHQLSAIWSQTKAAPGRRD